MDKKTDGAGELALGLKYFGGIGCKEDKAKAEKHFAEALKCGEKKAAYWLGMCVQGTDEKRAEKYFKSAMKDGDNDAARALGLLLKKQHRYKAAAQAFTLGSQRGDDGCRYYLGLQLMTGLGIAEDRNRAMALFEEAARGGDMEALAELGRAYMLSHEYEKAEPFIARAAEKGCLKALALLGRLKTEEELFLCERYGTKPNEATLAEGLKYCLPAARGDDPDGIYCLARAYESGLGVKKDEKKALVFALSAAKLGNAEAMALVGKLYEEGRGTGKDVEVALRCYTAANSNGYKCPSDIKRVKKLIE